MEHKSIIRTIATLIVITGMTLFVLFFSVDTRLGVTYPKVEQGVLDVSHWDFHQDGNVKLNGEWEFYPQALLTPSDIRAAKPSPYFIAVPSIWSTDETEHFMPDVGVGTYRMQVHVDPAQKHYALKTTYIRNASSIYINGELAVASGSPAPSIADGYVSHNVPMTHYFTVEDAWVDIVIQVANLDYYYGGIIQSISFGTQSSIMVHSVKAVLIDMMGIAFLLISGVYYFGIYLKRHQDPSFLYFSIITFAYAFIVMTASERLFMQFFPSIPYMLAVKIKMVVIGVSFIFITLFIRALNHVIFPKAFIRILIGLVSLLYVPVVFLPHALYAKLEMALSAIGLVFLLMVVYYIARPFVTKRYGSMKRSTLLLLLAVIVSIVIQLFSTSLYVYSYINTPLLSNLALLFFLFGIAAIFAEHYSQAYEDLEILSNKLIATDKMKDEFLVHTSHEFKTPLHGIMNMAQMLMEEDAPLSHKQRENLTYIVSLSTRLSALVNDIIDFQSLQNKTLAFHKRTLDVNAPVQATLDVLRYLRKGEELTLINRIPHGIYFVNTDENRFKQILTNLIGNALKFTEKGTVAVDASTRDGWVAITVSDTGVGIREEDQRLLFTDTLSPSEVNYTEVTSTGMGLKISRLLAMQLSGDLYLERSIEGVGTTFVLLLPVATGGVDTELAESSARANTVARDDIAAIVEAQDVHDHRAVAANAVHAIKILLVDDEPSNIKVLQELFHGDAYETLVAYNGAQALELLQAHTDVALVLLDVMMPGMSGYEVSERIRQLHPIYQLPILLLTVRQSPADIAAGLDAGANDFLVKPFAAKELMARAKTLLRMREAVQEAIQLETLFLQAQMKPHFIYNVLSIIMSMCYRDGAQAGQLLGEFSNYLRLSFDIDPHRPFITLRRELALVQSYTALEQARFGERLHVNIHVHGDLMEISLPALTIQPLVENAIRHGLMKRIAGGDVNVRVQSDGERIRIVVADNGVGIATDKLATLLTAKQSEGGIALRNVHQRLIHAFGYGLHIESQADVGTTVQFHIPIRMGKADERGIHADESDRR